MNFFVSTLIHIDIEKTIHNYFWNYSNGYSVKIQGKLYFSDTMLIEGAVVMNYIKRIRDLQEDRDFSQSAVAKAIHVAQTTYSDYENGKVRIPVECLVELAKFYDVDINYITGVSLEKKHFPEK